MRASCMAAALSGVCAAFILMPQAEASILFMSVDVSGTGTATYSTSSDDPSFQPRSGSGPATFSADGNDFVGELITNVSISIPGAGIAINAEGDPFSGASELTGISSTGVGPIHIVADNGDAGFGLSEVLSEVTLTPTSVTSRFQDGMLVYTIAGTGQGDAQLIEQVPSSVPFDPTIFTYRTDVTLDIKSFTGTVQIAEAPVPASAPMFGAGLAALGALCYGLKRRRQPQDA